ncbi:MAG: hypothetical protein ACPGVU_19140 [Limisphaerales bacterium]
MLDRASSFSNPEIIRLLQTKFIPVAIDQAYHRRQKDNEGRFYQKIANQSPRKVGGGTTQGHYVATAEGEFLGYNNNRAPERALRMMRKALAEFQPTKVKALDPGKVDRRFVLEAPKGGLVARVHTKILGGYEPTENQWRQMFQNNLGRDNLWIRADEHRALVKGRLPESLIHRLAKNHLVDNTRGEPPMWNANEIRHHDIHLQDGRLTGSIELRTSANDRAFKAEVFGQIESKNNQITRFDLVFKGLFRGEGRYTRNAPKGEFPIAMAFELADGTDPADSIPPQGSRGWLDGYIR